MLILLNSGVPSVPNLSRAVFMNSEVAVVAECDEICFVVAPIDFEIIDDGPPSLSWIRRTGIASCPAATLAAVSPHMHRLPTEEVLA